MDKIGNEVIRGAVQFEPLIAKVREEEHWWRDVRDAAARKKRQKDDGIR